MLHRKTLILAVIVCMMAVSTFAESNARIVRLSFVEGDVQLDRQEGRGFSHAFLNMPIVEGTKVWTKSDARAEIEFEDGSTVRLAPDSVMEFQQLRRLGRGERSSMLVLQEGTAYFNIDKDKNDDFRVVFANEHLTFDNKARFRVSVDAREYRLAVFRGDVEILKSTGGRVAVRKNENLTVEFEDRDRYFLAKGTPSEAHDYWDREREDAIAEYARRREYDRYDRAYSYGYHDLHRWGSFIHVDIGTVWRPRHVSLSWTPYDSGYWVYYPGHGYVFVSSYPWGWTPYRYGSWVYLNRHGWCWRPTNNHHTWVTVLNFNNAPHGYVPPARPTVVTANVTPRTYVPIIRGRARLDADDTDGRGRIVEGGAPTGGSTAGGVVNATVTTERSGRPSGRGVITNETLPVDPNRGPQDSVGARSGRVSRSGGMVQADGAPQVGKQRDIDDSSRMDEVRREEPTGVAPGSTSGGVINGRVERRGDVDGGGTMDVRSDRSSRIQVQQQPNVPSQPSVIEQRPVETPRPVEQRVDRPQRTYNPPPTQQVERPQRVYTPPPQPQVDRSPRVHTPPPSPPPQVQQSRPASPPPTAAPERSSRIKDQ